MAFTESNMMDLGNQAPDFTLWDSISNRQVSFQDVKGGNGTCILFICNHCPYVIHVNDMLVKLANEFMAKDIGFVAINSNDVVNYPEDAPDKMSIVAKVLQYPFPYLFDESQEVAKAYDAACTPDIYVFDGENKLYYRGRLDDSRPNSGTPLSGKDLRNAFDRLLAGQPSPEKQYPSGGCNIKWKKA
ncbi:MAG: thioredoxin family protein [Saprospiraceae bacterium]